MNLVACTAPDIILCLFSLNDILSSVNSNIDGIIGIEDIQIFLLLFADDAVLFAQDPESLQSMLYDIENYSNIWGLRLNTNKTKIMIFENGRHTNYDFFIYNSRIEIVNAFKYLGVYFYKNGNWNRTQKRIAQHASFSLHNLFIVCNQLDLPTLQKVRLFDSLVAQTLNYAAEVWGHHEGPDIEAIHSKFCRKVLCVRRSTNLNALYGELGRIPMSIQRKLIMIKYWIKLLTLNDQSLLYKTYNMLKIDLQNGETYNRYNWAYQIKHILDECGLSIIWQNQLNMLIDFQLIRQRMLDIYYQTWYSSINNSRRLETYCLLKHTLGFEKYLDFIKDAKFRIALSKFRTSSHDLAIEKGRYINLDRNNRVYNNCNLKLIENEYHFLLICPKYSELRSKYIKRYYYTWPTVQKFSNLMSANSKVIVRNLSKFIYFANLRRN